MKRRIQGFFSEVPARYEKVNHILTFGLDVYWRGKASAVAASARDGLWLDLCSGTGEMAGRLLSKARSGTYVIATDFSMPMLSRAAGRKDAGKMGLLVSDVTELPFGDGTFDLLTLSFATRNLNAERGSLTLAFREFHRVLRPGGLFVSLETSRPASPALRSLRDLYVRILVGPLGRAISGSGEAYSFLSSSIRSFHAPDELSAMMRASGFRDVAYSSLTWGIAAVHRALKEDDAPGLTG